MEENIKLMSWNSKFDPTTCRYAAVFISHSQLEWTGPFGGVCEFKINKHDINKFKANISLLEFSTDETSLNGKTMLYPKSERKNIVLLNPNLVIEYNKKTRYVKVRTAFACTSQFRFCDDELFDEFIK